MTYRIFGKSVTGYSHLLKHKECQDSYRRSVLPCGISIAAVADGHGSNQCPYSADGSRIAVRIFCTLLKSMISATPNLNDLASLLKDDSIILFTKRLQKLWTDAILSMHWLRRRDIDTLFSKSSAIHALRALYGTTLLGVMTTPDFHFVYQLGDGDITVVNNNKVYCGVEAVHFLGTETFSLSSEHPEQKSVSHIYRPEDIGNASYILTTDGFKNSFISDSVFEETCLDYIHVLETYGERGFAQNLPRWLSETSKDGCGDDITMAIVTPMTGLQQTEDMQ